MKYVTGYVFLCLKIRISLYCIHNGNCFLNLGLNEIINQRCVSGGDY